MNAHTASLATCLAVAFLSAVVWALLERSAWSTEFANRVAAQESLEANEAELGAQKDRTAAAELAASGAQADRDAAKRNAERLNTELQEVQEKLTNETLALAVARARLEVADAQMKSNDALRAQELAQPKTPSIPQPAPAVQPPSSRNADTREPPPSRTQNVQSYATEAKLAAATAELKRAQDLLTTLDRRNRELERQNQALLQQNRSGSSAYSQLQSSVNALRSENDSLSKENSRLRSIEAQLRRELATARGAVKK